MTLSNALDIRALLVLGAGDIPGGHVVQATKTAAALEALGVDVTLTSEADAHDFAGYEVVHSFGGLPDIGRRARAEGAAVAISPIWWSAEYTAGSAALNRAKKLERNLRVGYSIAQRGIVQTAQRLRESIDRHALIFESADVLLPNSEMEAQQIRNDLRVSTPMRVVPNAIDETEFPASPPRPRAGVAYVGRLEPHKNQLGLIEELKNSGIALTIAGFSHPHHVGYVERCRRRADASTTFLVDAHHEVVMRLFQSSAVHVIPSWFETTGLASLEAAAGGCAIVTTSRGFAREYFGDLATYCDPGKRGSIRHAVERALSLGPSAPLRERVLSHYTWSRAAHATIDGYRLALAGSGRTR
jgi:glycosyltransferase involved in cell wall biosynthesis